MLFAFLFRIPILDSLARMIGSGSWHWGLPRQMQQKSSGRYVWNNACLKWCLATVFRSRRTAQEVLTVNTGQIVDVYEHVILGTP